MTKTIELIVLPTGQTTVQTKGFTGASCQDASRFIEQALGQQLNERLTGEYFLQQTEQPRLQEGA